MHIDHPVLMPGRIGFRGYQANLARIAADQDTMVVLPTGMGKTVVALLVLADVLKDGGQRVLLMAPTKPLVEQHQAFLKGVLQESWSKHVQALTGHVSPKQRAAAYAERGIVCATPQVVQNDVIRGALDLSSFDLVIFDECHRAVGEYAYAFLGQEMVEKGFGARRLGLTASPGHDVEKIQEVRQNLGLHHVEIRTPADKDVAPYVQDVVVQWETLPLPPNLARVSERLRGALQQRTRFLRDNGYLKSSGSRISRKALLEAARKLQLQTKRSDCPPEVYACLSVQAQAMKLLHAIELAETQGAEPFVAFIQKMQQEASTSKPSKATLNILDDAQVNEAFAIAQHDHHENPKMGRTEVLVQETLERNHDSKVLVFAQYRSTVEAITEHLAMIPGVRPVIFVGQGTRAGKKGLTQKEQQEVLQRFRDGEHNVLVATSVAEEGLDIPQTDLVVFYEPIPSEIRAIQRRGRTGRQRDGQVVVLMTKGTQDEAAHWMAKRKEQDMVTELQRLRTSLDTGQVTAPGQRQQTLDAAVEHQHERPLDVRPMDGPRILCDHREQAGGVLRHLHRLGAIIDLRTLDVGDFVVSDRVVIERKECADFIDSLLDGRLFEQMQGLNGYDRAVLVLEGDGLWGHRNVQPDAIMGAMGSLLVDHQIPVVQTADEEETARFVLAVAKREQGKTGRSVAARHGLRAMDDSERMLYILAGFPGVDRTRAQALLDHFGSLQAVFQATPDDLQQTTGIGPKTAKSIHRMLVLERAAQTL